jgi:hypothetical protein
MADARLVRRVGYKEQYGACCDFVFGAELCLAAREVFYLHDYVSVYRKTATSISHSTRGTAAAATLSAYAFVRKLKLPPQLEPSRKLALRRLAPIVVSVHARNRQARQGLKIALGHLFAYRYGFSARLYYHLLMLSRAAVNARGRVGMVAGDAVMAGTVTESVARASAAATVTAATVVAATAAAGATATAAPAAALTGERGTTMKELIAELTADTTESR